jgi:tRNA G10  N-methylase Trm11
MDGFAHIKHINREIAEQELEFLKASDRISNQFLEYSDDIVSLLYKNIEEAERTRANMKRYCWVLSMDSFYKICKYFNVEFHIDKHMTIMGYKAKCSSLLPPNTIIFADILWGDEDD